MDNSHLLQVVNGRHSNINVGLCHIYDMRPLLVAVESYWGRIASRGRISLPVQISSAVKTGSSLTISRNEDYQLIVCLLLSLRRSRSGLKNMILRKELRSAEHAYVQSTYDKPVARKLLRELESRDEI